MDLLVENLQDQLPINLQSVKDTAKALLKFHQIIADELMIYFVTEETLCELHEQHFDDPSPTDCISIQVDPPGASPCFLGEIFISPRAAIDHCQKHEGSVYEELTLYLVHGFLHLIGFDDIKTHDREKMRLAEKKSMDYLLSCHKIISK